MKKLVSAAFLVIFLGSLKAYSGSASSPDTSAYGQPLRLQNFRARIVSTNRIELSWLTAETWTTVTHYELQRSVNNKDFTVAGVIQQTSSQPFDQQYAFTDELGSTSGITTVYYRLRQLNRDGRESFSFVLAVKLNSETGAALSIWPNPVVDDMNIGFESPVKGLVTICIFDMSGRKVVEQQYNSGKGLNMVKIEAVKQLNAGVHIVQVRVDGIVTGTGRLLKQLK